MSKTRTTEAAQPFNAPVRGGGGDLETAEPRVNRSFQRFRRTKRRTLQTAKNRRRKAGLPSENHRRFDWSAETTETRSGKQEDFLPPQTPKPRQLPPPQPSGPARLRARRRCRKSAGGSQSSCFGFSTNRRSPAPASARGPCGRTARQNVRATPSDTTQGSRSTSLFSAPSLMSA